MVGSGDKEAFKVGGVVDALLSVDFLLKLKDMFRGFILPSFYSFLWLLVCWSLWLFRNQVVFDAKVWKCGEVLSFIKNLGWDWLFLIEKGD